jgi:hypothetical protein
MLGKRSNTELHPSPVSQSFRIPVVWPPFLELVCVHACACMLLRCVTFCHFVSCCIVH